MRESKEIENAKMHFAFYLVTMKPNAPRYSLDCPKNLKNARNKNPSAFYH